MTNIDSYHNLEQSERPWGTWYSLFKDLRSPTKYQIKKILVNPGAKLSLQMHNHRSEHGIVLSGSAKVTCGEQVFSLYPGQSTFIPMGEKHSLENPGMIDLEIIEIQMGEFISEDDIIRLDHGFDSEGNRYI